MSKREKILVLIHGAWHTSEYFKPAVEIIKNKYPETIVLTPDLLREKYSNPIKWAIYVNEQIKKLNKPNAEIYILGHSQGGLTAQAYAALYNPAATIFYTAFILPPKSSMVSAYIPSLTSQLFSLSIKYNKELGFYSLPKPKVRMQMFYHDCKNKEFTEKIKNNLVKEPFGVGLYKNVLPNKYHGKLYYLKATKDQGIPPKLQELIIQKSQIQFNDIAEIPTSHSGFMCKPEMFVEGIKRWVWG